MAFFGEVAAAVEALLEEMAGLAVAAAVAVILQ